MRSGQEWPWPLGTNYVKIRDCKEYTWHPTTPPSSVCSWKDSQQTVWQRADQKREMCKKRGPKKLVGPLGRAEIENRDLYALAAATLLDVKE